MLSGRKAIVECSLMKSALTFCVWAAIPAVCQISNGSANSAQDLYRFGHSHQGAAFDIGPRQKPWKMEGIGRAHFPITTSNPEVQMWFDQGNALLHSFWYYEAERSFRWCLKLEPDNAMAWWGMARATSRHDRAVRFIGEARKREGKITERERLYIDAWAAQILDDPLHPATQAEKDAKHKEILETLVLKYPEDIEAKSLLALANLADPDRYGVDLILQQVLKVNPDHPGALHYRIHLWNSTHPERALASAELFRKLVPNIGHAQHMPGHLYSTLGMYNEAAIAMDTANRVEKRYMRQRMIFPWSDWNYAHNANYLGYVLEQLGMAQAAIGNAEQLLDVSLDPEFNEKDKFGTYGQGIVALMRVLIKYERWKQILDPKTFHWGQNPRDNMYRSYCETLTYIGLGDPGRAETSYAAHQRAKDGLKTPGMQWLLETYNIQALELKAKLALAKGDTFLGLSTLADAAKREITMRREQNDPPFYPTVLYNALGEAYLDRKSPQLAEQAFENTLDMVRNDPFALSGLVVAYSQLGEKEKVRQTMGRLLYEWSDADAGLRWMDQARALVSDAKPYDNSPEPERNYKATSLDRFGPAVWEPYPAPALDVVDTSGKHVTLDQFRGRNVLLIFYLGDECPHCLEQLIEIGKHKMDFAKAGTEILAVSSNTPEHNAEFLREADLPFRLLTDADHENARRFQAYDDFEDLELHATILIDKQGRVYWARAGGDPFNNVPFLLKELQRMNAQR